MLVQGEWVLNALACSGPKLEKDNEKKGQIIPVQCCRYAFPEILKVVKNKTRGPHANVE